ncbi:MAG: carotenoid oxygenase family protein [Antricoccus sp.]
MTIDQNTRPDFVATTVDTDAENPYLLGIYAPVHQEIDARDLEVVGEIPRDLNGVYLRNGPNRRYKALGRYHWFDGDGMIHALHFENGTARYQNRWVRTEAFKAESAAGKSLWTGVVENPANNPFGNHHGLGIKDSANTDLIHYRGKVLATWYLCGSPMAIDPLSLQTIGAEDFLGTLHGDMMAHPKTDERTGELFWFDYGPQAPYMRYGVAGADGAISSVTDIDLPGPRLPHDMGITDHYAILMDLPLIQDEAARRAGRYRIQFEAELPARFAILPRYATDQSQLKWFEASPCYIYHVVNSWEEGDEVVMDVCRTRQGQHARIEIKTPLAQMLAYLKMDAQLWRYRFSLKTGQTTEGPRDEDKTEFPSIDNRLAGQKNRYTYNAHIAQAETVLFDGITRYDLQTGDAANYRYGDGRFGSESPFAPRDGSNGDDDGYLVSFVTDENDQSSVVEVLDAADIAAGPVATIKLPQRVPLGFHATWLRPDQLNTSA